MFSRKIIQRPGGKSGTGETPQALTAQRRMKCISALVSPDKRSTEKAFLCAAEFTDLRKKYVYFYRKEISNHFLIFLF
jgi:hypothetical protein